MECSRSIFLLVTHSGDSTRPFLYDIEATRDPKCHNVDVFLKTVVFTRRKDAEWRYKGANEHTEMHDT